MTEIHTYLTFNGNCREAMIFYRDCLGGELTLQTIGESPMADKMPLNMREHIMHSTLKKDKLILMGSDMCPDSGRTLGNAVSLIIMCTSEEEIRNYYKNLSSGADATNPLEITFWGALFGGVTDKFGNHWLLNYDQTLN